MAAEREAAALRRGADPVDVDGGAGRGRRDDEDVERLVGAGAKLGILRNGAGRRHARLDRGQVRPVGAEEDVAPGDAAAEHRGPVDGLPRGAAPSPSPSA